MIEIQQELGTINSQPLVKLDANKVYFDLEKQATTPSSAPMVEDDGQRKEDEFLSYPELRAEGNNPNANALSIQASPDFRSTSTRLFQEAELGVSNPVIGVRRKQFSPTP